MFICNDLIDRETFFDSESSTPLVSPAGGPSLQMLTG
jgi:hypothetical protein